ncbi:GDP-mannose-dependent alpha-(1-6)-phosphatidylinositol monomannoside mannosyltransferase [Planctomycetes bacterium MalM25]|nr:GDP-mannose-dependent alpha-(1-6)-phosphatidylinositol monomannoside mannosyltransferase [Planctomycetes bacterium MalM25]
MSGSDTKPNRVILVQPTLPKYRVPVYRGFAERPQIDLRLWFGNHTQLKNAEPEGFDGELRPMRQWVLGSQEAMWHQAQLDAARDPDADAIILSWSSRYLSLGPALRTAKRRGLPVVLWGHGYSRSESPWRVWARNRLASMAGALLFYDDQTAQAAIDSGWDADRVFVAPNAIDQTPIAAAREAWRADPERLERFRADEGLNDRDLLLYVSRLSEKAEIPLLLEAVDKLRRRRPQLLLALIGDGEMQEELERRIPQLGLQDHVRMVGPIYEQDRLAPWFLTAELFVYPTAIGLSLLHAMGYGLPVVTDDRMGGHFPEIVAFNPDPDSPDANGATYRAGDTDSFADTLEALLDDPARRKALSAGGIRTVEQRYNVPAMVDGMVAAVERALH